MSMFLPERFGRAQGVTFVRVVCVIGVDARVLVSQVGQGFVNVLLDGRTFFNALCRGQDIGTFVGELVLKVFGSEDRHFGQQKFSFDRFRAGVIQHGPDWDLEGMGRR